MPYLETIEMNESEGENKEMNESDEDGEVPGNAGKKIIGKKKMKKM